MKSRRARALSAGAPVLALLLFAQAAEGTPQDPPVPEVADILVEGERKVSTSTIIDLSGIRRGQKLTPEKVDKAYKELWATGKFDQTLTIETRPDPGDPANPDKAVVVIRVSEYPTVEEVELLGFDALAPNDLKAGLRIAPGDPLNPQRLKQDRTTLRDRYLDKGHLFSRVEENLRPGPAGGVVLAWQAFEGPLVSVERIVFSGVEEGDESEIRRYMLTKDEGSFLGIPTGAEPFVERNLREDIERIKLYYRLEGWLDIRHGENVFVRDVAFNGDKTGVTITIHVDEGRRYRVRGVRFEFDGASRRIFDEEEMRSWLVSKPGKFYNENDAGRDVAGLRERYGERAYITAEIEHEEIVSKDRAELDLVYTIKENDKVYVGRLTFEGNSKSREKIFRREFTRTGFAPGEEFNNKAMKQAMRRIQDRGWVEPGTGIQARTADGDAPDVKDVAVTVREEHTGNIRFAAGFSSSFGILGLVEISQRNFDIARLPSSVGEIFDGTGFAGGGQSLTIRLAPAARRQSYVVDFREPYVFGYDFGLGLTGYARNTSRESYDERRLGGRISLDKRFDPFRVDLGFKAEQAEIDDIETSAPPAVQEIEGLNKIFALSPGITYDTRDSVVFPTEGLRVSLGYDYTGQVLPGDFDFNRITFETEGHVTLHETETRLRHVLSSKIVIGWVHGARRVTSVPLIERFYAGGRDSIRGFDFRDMGPHEGGDPVGGEALVVTTVEYSYPLFVEFLRGAFFYDLANLTSSMSGLYDEKWRNTVGMGVRILIPGLGNVPVKLDFGRALTLQDEDEEELITFDIGSLF